MVSQIPIFATGLIPLTSLVSFTIYLSIHPKSPVRSRKIALSAQRDDGLTKDPFDIYDDTLEGDGEPVDPDAFWKSMYKRKLALLLCLILPFVANIALLALSVLDDTPNPPFDPVIPPALLLPSHLVTLVLAYWFLSQNDTPSHWSTTIHLATGIFVQFVILAVIALLPHEPFPSRPESLLANFLRSDLVKFPSQPIPILRSLLSILNLAPLIVVLFIRRGPPLFVELDKIYPPKIAEAIPTDHPSLDPSQANVCEEVQATIPEWLLFGYVTNVVKKGYMAESMDVWDLPVLPKNMRKFSPSYADVGALSCYHTFKNVYGSHTKRLGKSEGYNLLKKIAIANQQPLYARKFG